MITRVHRRGQRVGGLLRYLFGPGRCEEHVRPRLVAAWDGAGPLADLEPGRGAGGRRDVRRLVALLDQPVRAAPRAPRAPVWHASMRLAPEDRHRVFSDATWGHLAQQLLVGAGLVRSGDLAGIRWVAVRHNDDHVHVVATLVREDGRIEWARNDYRRCMAATAGLAGRFGLRRVPHADATAVRAPGPREVHRARRLGMVAPPRQVLRTRVRIAAAVVDSPQAFVAQLRAMGVVVRLRHSPTDPTVITGYAVALPEPDGVVVFFSGGRLAPELSLPRLQARWGTPVPERTHRGGGGPVRVLHRAAGGVRAATERLRHAGSDPVAAQATVQAAADLLHAVGYHAEGLADGPISGAAQHFDRAARAPYARLAAATRHSQELRRFGQRLVMTGRLSGGRPVRGQVRLLLAFARLAETLGRWRHAQQRWHQAQAAGDAAGHLRRAAARRGRVGALRPMVATTGRARLDAVYRPTPPSQLPPAVGRHP